MRIVNQSSDTPHSEAEREIRFGLVLYGGVSLAVYIYGVALEFERLVRASCGAETNAWTPILRKARVTATVDIVSGASAGGINGVLLGKALATGAKLSSVRKIWTDEADIGRLLRETSEKEPASLLRTDRFEELLTGGLKTMDEAATGKPLTPVFDLFIASTRLQPWVRQFSTDLGGSVSTGDYRKSFELKLRSSGYNDERAEAGYDRNDFAASANKMLAEVARATSAFPVAFEPKLIRCGEHNERLFLKNEPEASYFSDGGILHNKPFTETISTIFTRAASRPVDRWLVSVEPDPEMHALSGPAVEPDAAEVAGKALMGIPRYQSLVADLSRLQEHRRRADSARKKLQGIDEVLLNRIDELQARGDAALEAWKDEVLAASDYRRERRRRAEETLKRRASSRSSAEVWDQAAVRALVEALESAKEIPDPDSEQRRIYRLLEMTRELQGRADASAAEAVGKAKLALWGQFDRIEELLWEIFDSKEKAPKGRPASCATEAMDRLRKGLAEVAGEVASICRTLDELDSGRFSKVFRWFELWDAQLLTIAEVSGVGARDRINFARISPTDAKYINKETEDKLAGDTMAHFSGFLKESWRCNDLLWGRLDAAEMICRMIAGPVEGDTPAPLSEAQVRSVQEEIFADEHKEKISGDYRSYLESDDYKVGKETLNDLPRSERADLALHSGAVIRNMLRRLGKSERPPVPLRKLFSRLGTGLGLLLALGRGPVRLWARLRQKADR